MSDNSSPATTGATEAGDNTQGATTPPDYSSPNDLDFEMTAEEEKAFVDETLGLSGGKKDDSSGEHVSKPVDKKEQLDDKTAKIPDEKPKDSDDTRKEVVTPEPTAQVTPEVKEEITEPSTDDLWIEVENADGEKIKLEFDPSDPSSFLPDDFTFKSDKQLADILEAKMEMANLFKDRTAEYEKSQEADQEIKTAEQKQADTLAGWDAEIELLVESGVLDAPGVKPGDKGYLEDPAVQKIDTVFKYMADTNDKRRAEGKPLIASFGAAFNLYTHDEQVKAEVETKAKEAEEIKKRGAMVGGGSAASGGEKKVYKSGSYSSIWDVPVE